jgi:hypothetical protein
MSLSSKRRKCEIVEEKLEAIPKTSSQQPVCLFTHWPSISAERTCTHGERCRLLYDVEVRDYYTEKERREAETEFRKSQAVGACFTSELAEPQFAILVSGYGDHYKEGSRLVNTPSLLPPRNTLSTFAISTEFKQWRDQKLTGKVGYKSLQKIQARQSRMEYRLLS